MSALRIIAFLLLAYFSSVRALGYVSISHQCPFDVYYKTVSQLAEEDYQVLPLDGFILPYDDEIHQGQGVSIKLSHIDSVVQPPIVQLEYNWNSSQSTIFYDLSNIDGHPDSRKGYAFARDGMRLTPSAGPSRRYPACTPIRCPPGVLKCREAYNLPEDLRTLACPDSTSLSLELCF